jgi:glycine amidinotransferase
MSFRSEISEGSGVGAPVVNSYTEWDPLEEVVVGSLASGVFPTWQDSMAPVLPHDSARVFQDKGGTPLPAEHAAAAEAELNQFAAVLEGRGIKVVRPDFADHTRTFATPDWESSGNSSGMPRDLLIVVGDTIVETPMSWRCRKHEVDAFRSLIKSYFRRGGGWLAAPQPQLTQALFDGDFDQETETGHAISEFEPVFDAADFMRFGDDLIVQRSHVTNEESSGCAARSATGSGCTRYP